MCHPERSRTFASGSRRFQRTRLKSNFFNFIANIDDLSVLSSGERAKARAACGDAGSRNESCWLVMGMLLFVLQGCKFTVGKLLVILSRSLRRRLAALPFLAVCSAKTCSFKPRWGCFFITQRASLRVVLPWQRRAQPRANVTKSLALWERWHADGGSPR